ncbi:hypothetical protein RAAC3_TM7C00001G0341 [Candidatus Saccharibacteria bacterium RAAC3_TM7_1]|nr:hypothetical protein RAAC3_TM7C00001G0341 [Candidatus Saccharibacteria bacterium RAAC3_TM7_1]HCZ28296.1 hypothetical protein [Candidatus Saccharibacteria bacterium]
MAELSVASWNILLDGNYPQEERIDDIIGTLKEVHRIHALGALGIMEVQETLLGHSGQMIAQALFGNDGAWQLHSRKKRKEHIGLAGPEIEEVEFVELGHSKYAALTQAEGVTVATVHLRKKRGQEQVEQMDALLERLEEESQVVLMGDFNGIKLQRPRQKIWRQNYRSVFTELSMKRQYTVPTPEFKGMLTRPERVGAFVLGGGVNVDDIYVRGVDVIGAGYFKGRSDHLGVWADLETKAAV